MRENGITARLAGTSINNLLPKYQREQDELKKQLITLQEQSAEHDSTEQNAEKWISLIRQYSDLQELNSCIIIHYRFIGNLTDGGMVLILLMHTTKKHMTDAYTALLTHGWIGFGLQNIPS